MLRRGFDEVTEHAVLLDFELGDSGLGAIARLECENNAARFVAKRQRLIERAMCAARNETAVARQIGRLGNQQPSERLRKRRYARHPFAEILNRNATLARNSTLPLWEGRKISE